MTEFTTSKKIRIKVALNINKHIPRWASLKRKTK